MRKIKDYLFSVPSLASSPFASSLVSPNLPALACAPASSLKEYPLFLPQGPVEMPLYLLAVLPGEDSLRWQLMLVREWK